MKSAKLLAFATLAAIAAMTTVPASALPAGPVVVAKVTGQAMLVWQATPFVAELVSKREPQEQAVADLVSGALQILERRKDLLSKASGASIKVVSAAIQDSTNPRYAATTFAGFKELLTLTATKSALAESSKWPKTVDPAHLPNGVKVDIAPDLAF